MVPQRRHPHHHHLEAVVQILTEVPLFDFRFEIPIGRRQHSDIHLHFTVAANGPALTLLKDAQEFRLHANRHITNLIEENGPVHRFDEEPFARDLRPGKRPFDMAEEFALQQPFGHGGAVDRHKRVAAPWTLEV